MIIDNTATIAFLLLVILHLIDASSSLCNWTSPDGRVFGRLSELRNKQHDYVGSDGSDDILWNMCGPAISPVCSKYEVSI